MTLGISNHKTVSIETKQPKSYTTEPKLKRLSWHKQDTVKTRATALQESFYPTIEIQYSAAVNRMASLLGIVDRSSVLAYLGRPASKKRNEIDQEVTYVRSCTRVQKRHTFIQKLPIKKGYIETFNLGYIYVENEVWFIHWNHVEQKTFPFSHQGECSSSHSVENISLLKIRDPNNHQELMESDSERHLDGHREERENLSEREIVTAKVIGEVAFNPNLLCGVQRPKLEDGAQP